MQNGTHIQPVGLLQDVKTRWNSTFNMLVRARRLQQTIVHWIEQNPKFSPLQPTEDEWRQVDQAIIFLQPFSDYTYDISSSTKATIQNAYFIYNDIFEHIAQQRRQVRSLPNAPWITGLLDASKATKKILQKYYSDTSQRGFIYNIATILDPSKKLSMYDSCGNVRIQDPTMQVGVTSLVSYTDFYRYVGPYHGNIILSMVMTCSHMIGISSIYVPVTAMSVTYWYRMRICDL